MTRDEMIEVMARAIETESNLRRYGLYDYTGYSSSYAPHVVRNEDDRSVILRSHSAEEANGHYEQLNRSRLALAALSALEAAGYVVAPKEPSDEILVAGDEAKQHKMSDAEWLQRELGLEPGHHDAEMIKARIPEAAAKIVERAALETTNG